jgi:spermidine/putrescine transport system substrate-binding protein
MNPDRLLTSLVPQLLGACLASLVTVSCEKEIEMGGGASRSLERPGSGPGGDQGSALTVYTWSDYLDPETLERFTAETGIAVDYQTFGTAGEMEEGLKSNPGGYDVVIVDDSIITQLATLRLLQPLDHAKLSNMGNIDAKYSNQPFDPGNRFSIPYLWGTTLIAYRTDRVTPEELSWGVLWSDEAAGGVMLLEEPVQLFTVVLTHGGRPYHSMEEGDQALAVGRVNELISERGARLGGDEEVKEMLKSGEVWVAMCYSTDAAMLADEDEMIDYFVPEEGAPLWIDNFAIPRDSLRPELAHRFIDFMIEAEAAAASANYAWSASPNSAAAPLVTEDVAGDPRITPSREVLERCYFLPALDQVRVRVTDAFWVEVMKAVASRDGAPVPAAGDSAFDGGGN